jgi:hypothetical protein
MVDNLKPGFKSEKEDTTESQELTTEIQYDTDYDNYSSYTEQIYGSSTSSNSSKGCLSSMLMIIATSVSILSTFILLVI